MKLMKSQMVKLVILSLIAIIVSGLTFPKNKKRSSSFIMSSSSFSSSFSSNGEKPETHTRSMKVEEHRDQEDDKPEQVRKYGEYFSKDNDDPALLRRKANTNVEEEEMLLRGHSEENKILGKQEETKYYKKLDDEFNDFFNMGSSFLSDKKEENDYSLSPIEEISMNHSNYDKFLEERKNRILESTKLKNKKKKSKKEKK